jgi:hypothetical protein
MIASQLKKDSQLSLSLATEDWPVNRWSMSETPARGTGSLHPVAGACAALFTGVL